MLLSLNSGVNLRHPLCLPFIVNSCLCSGHVTYVPKRVSTIDERVLSHQ